MLVLHFKFVFLLLQLSLLVARTDENVVRWGSWQAQGRRPYQEDRFHTQKLKDALYFGMFDGHGGSYCSDFVSDKLVHEVTTNSLWPSDIPEALKFGFNECDKKFLQQDLPSGSAALVGILQGNDLWVANAGDCRAVLSRNALAVALSTDHKPNLPEESKRITEAGSKVINMFGVWRVDGTLAMSRAMGDRHLKPNGAVICEPEVRHFQLNPSLGNDEFIIFASDGLWDVMSNQDAVDIIHMNPHLRDAELAAKALVSVALQLGSLDNISATVVFLSPTISSVALQHTEL